ncbi:unnamed protein product [Effrenium voratum]|nr:unnamed protein product [Effrenium voratum]
MDDVAELARAVAIIAEDDPEGAAALLGVSALPAAQAGGAGGPNATLREATGPRSLQEAIESDDFDVDVKLDLAVLGSQGVGKTSLVRRFASNIFQEEYSQTWVTDFVEKKRSFSGEDVTLHIWDTPGSS